MIGGQVASYELLFYGGPKGYQTNRAQIYLLDAEGRALAFVRFKDPGMKFQKDVVLPDGVIRMHLPSAMFHSVLDPPKRETGLRLVSGGKRLPRHVGGTDRRRGSIGTAVPTASSTQTLDG